MSRNLDKNGKMSQQTFWKVKKKLFPRLNVPHAVIDNYGNEVTDPFNIKTLYQSEFECCLRKRNIKVKLKEHESAVNELCNMRLENARCNTSSNYQGEEVQTAIKELKLGKSVDPTGLIREVFIRGGSGLVHSITTMFNAFKKNFDVLSQWDDILITTMFKKKDSWKKLDNYRGILIVTILQLIYEKVLKNRISGVLQINMSKFQNDGVKGKSVTDNLFILKGIIDNSKYLSKGVFITFYDIKKCFDSLWLKDCINALWDNGLFHFLSVQGDGRKIYEFPAVNCKISQNSRGLATFCNKIHRN